MMASIIPMPHDELNNFNVDNQILKTLVDSFSNYQLNLIKSLTKLTKANQILWCPCYSWDGDITVNNKIEKFIMYDIFAVINDKDSSMPNLVDSYNHFKGSLNYFDLQHIMTFILSEIKSNSLLSLHFYVQENKLSQISTDNVINKHLQHEIQWLNALLDLIVHDKCDIINPELNFNSYYKLIQTISHTEHANYVFQKCQYPLNTEHKEIKDSLCELIKAVIDQINTDN